MASVPNTTYDLYRNTALTSTLVLVRSGPTAVYGYSINNPNAAEGFIVMFDAASTGDVTLGTTIPDEAVKLPISGAVVETPHKAELPILFFKKGLVIASVTTETGSSTATTSIALRYK